MKRAKKVIIKTQAIFFGLIAIYFLGANTKLLNQRSDFNGAWLLLDQQSISGQFYVNGVPKQMKVRQKESDISIEKTTNGPDGDVTTNETLGFDGKVFETITPSKRKKLITLKWSSDRRSFTITANIYNATDVKKLEATIIDIWNLEDGRLTMIRKNENFANGEVWESKAVYEKQ